VQRRSKILFILTLMLVSGLSIGLAFASHSSAQSASRASANYITASFAHSAAVVNVAGITTSSIVTAPSDGTPFTDTVAFTDNNPNPSLTATINWGPGIPTETGVIGGTAPNFTVSGTHTYLNEGSKLITITLTDSSTTPPMVAVDKTTITVSEGDIAVTSGPANVIEGQPTTGNVLVFTDGTVSESVDTGASFTATVDWGDGSAPVAGNVTGAAGGPYTVSVPGSAHVYTDEGTFTAKVTVTETGVLQTPLFVASVPVTVGEGDVFSAPTFLLTSATEGTAIAGSTTIATFHDSNINQVPSDLTATINWGDGTSSLGTITDVAGLISVKGGHTYTEECSCAASVVLSDDAPGTATSTASGTVTVGEGDILRAGSITLSATEGHAATGSVATFTDSYTGNSAADFTATIHWGDGATSAGVVLYNAGAITVNAPANGHTYADEGPQTVSVTLSDDAPGTATATATGTITVAEGDTNPMPGAFSPTFNPIANLPFSGVVATFSDPGYPGNSPSDFSATINWGDGTPVTAGVVGGGNGTFTVSGTHTYTAPGQPAGNVVVTIRDDAPGTATGTVSGHIVGVFSACGVSARLRGPYYANGTYTAEPSIDANVGIPTASQKELFTDPTGSVNVQNAHVTACSNVGTNTASTTITGTAFGGSGAFTKGDIVTSTLYYSSPTTISEITDIWDSTGTVHKAHSVGFYNVGPNSYLTTSLIP
jgi:hypothetical protein